MEKLLKYTPPLSNRMSVYQQIFSEFHQNIPQWTEDKAEENALKRFGKHQGTALVGLFFCLEKYCFYKACVLYVEITIYFTFNE